MATEMQKRIISKCKVSKEEKQEIIQREIRKKDKYMNRNRGSYKAIYPSGDSQLMEAYETIATWIREDWNNATLRKKPDDPKKKIEPVTKPKPKPEIKPIPQTSEEPRTAKTKEEIKSIVDRLY